jgi:ABC-type glycerol-3-phosphate transport system substrate-binding protein
MMRRLAAIALALAMLSGCGSSSGGAPTQPEHVYKPNSNQNPDYEAH